MPRRLILLAAAFVLLFAPAIVAAQNAVVTGTVRSDAQQPVLGAAVRIPSLNLAAVTNEQGRYSITVPAARVTGQQVAIEASSIGYRSAEATITLRAGGGTVTHNFTLAEQAIQLDEVVVTGTVGRMERRAQAAVVSTINASRVSQIAPVQSVANLPQARTPGVVLRNNSGTSGTATTIRIRGVSSIDLSNDPLVFVNGIRMSSQNSNVYNVGGQERSFINDIKIEDIESMEIVKGPAAATLYGSDANAGVINIITKRGRANQGFTQTMTVEYGQASPNFEAPDNYARCTAANRTNPVFAACANVEAGTVLVDNPLRREDPFGVGRYRNLNWNLRGGGERYGVFMSLGADDENGTLPNNGFGHVNGRTGFDFFAHEKLRLELDFGIIQTTTQLPRNDNDIYGYLGGGLLGDPRTVGGAKDGWYGNNRQVTAISSYENVDKSTRFQPRVSATYNPMDWFSNRFTVGGDMLRTRAYSFWAKNDVGFWDDAPRNTGQIGEARRSQDRYTLEYLGNVVRSLTDDLRVDVSFGTQALSNSTDLTDASGQGLVNNDVRSVDAASRLSGGGQSSSQNRSIGIFGQTQLTWRERLYIQAGTRRDQSSSFGAESKPFWSPKIGVSYVISEEPLVADLIDALPDGLLTTLRLRGAYGIAGRQPSSGARSTFNPSSNQISPTTVVVGVRPNDTGNPELRAEKGKELELGFDAGFLNEKLGVELTYFRKRTTDQILELPVPGSQGAEGPRVNIGSLENRGLELALNARPITHRNVALDLRVAANTLENELLDLGEVPESQTRKVGFPLFGNWNYRILNVDVENNRVLVTDTMEFLGNSSTFPGYEGTLSGTLTLFGNVTLYAQADGRGDAVVYDNTQQFRDRQNGFTAPAVLGPAAYGVDADGNPTEAAKVKYMRRFGCIQPATGTCPAWVTETYVDEDGVTRGGRNLSRTQVRGDYIQDAGFVRLREASVSYRIPDRFVRQFARAQSATFSLAMRNIQMWTNFDGLDPETDQFLTVPQDKRWTARFFFTF